MRGYKAICWSIGGLSKAVSMKKTDAPSLSSHQLPVAPQLGVGHHMSFPSTCWNLEWLDLVKVWSVQSQLRYATTCKNPVMSRHCVTVLTHYSTSYNPSSTSKMSMRCATSPCDTETPEALRRALRTLISCGCLC